MTDSWKPRFRAAAAPALLITLSLCLFGPYTIYSGNEAEFTAGFWTLVRPLLFVAAASTLVLVAVGLVLPVRVFRAYVALLFGLAIVLWIQANFLVPDYGTFNGAAIDWSIESWRNPYEIGLWVAVPVLCVVLARYVFPIAAFASGMLVALQAMTLAVSAVHADPRTQPEWSGPADTMFELSRTRNVIHLVLDSFQSDLFADILEEDRQNLDRSMSGAVFFANHTGAFPTTIVSIPAMLTGTVYRNEMPLQHYNRDHFQSGSLFKAMRSAGYRVDSITEFQYDSNSATNFYRMRRPYVSFDEYVRFTTWQLADLSLFRHAPHILRPKIYNNQAWRLQTMFGPGDTSARRYHSVNGQQVLSDFARRFRVATDEPVYKFIHVGIPHPPAAVTATCEFAGVLRLTRENSRAQARCAITRVAEVLDRLRQLGIYDEALIVISSDHGLGHAPPKFANDRQIPPGQVSVLAGKAMALLIVKPPKSSGPVRISNAPSTITDIPATVLGVLGVPNSFPGQSALALDDAAVRTRSWAFYDWENEDWRQRYFESLDLLEISGRVNDGNSWKFRDTLYAPGAATDGRTRGVYDLHRSRSGVDYRWTAPVGFFQAPAKARAFEMKLRSIAPMPQTVTVLAGDRVLEKVKLSDQSWITVKQNLPQDAKQAATWVELRVDPPWRPRGESRMLGVQTRDVTWNP
jgi:hypothetical protein